MNFDLAHSIQLLGRTPGTLLSLLRGLPDDWTRPNEGGETFSPFDVVGHPIDGEETDWMPRARIILAGDPDRPFEPFDRCRHRERNRGRTLDDLLAEFSRLRQHGLAELSGWRLTFPQLKLAATHPALGRVTLAELLATWVVHDLGHLAQISRVMAKQYREVVGPWAAYLPVLSDHQQPRS